MVFNLNDLYKSVFGYVALPYPIVKQSAGNYIANSDEFNSISGVLTANKARQTSVGMLGNEIRMPVDMRIPGADWYRLPNEPIVSIKGLNDINITKLNRGGSRGTVKEIINLDDYVITIKGLAINESEDDYPEEIMSNIRKLCENGYVEIRSLKTDIWNIHLAVIRPMDFPGSADLPFNCQAYELQLISDQDFELEILQQQL